MTDPIRAERLLLAAADNSRSSGCASHGSPSDGNASAPRGYRPPRETRPDRPPPPPAPDHIGWCPVPVEPKPPAPRVVSVS